jgi:ATP-dependent Clp protease ATP-binding subunit ClpB
MDTIVDIQMVRLAKLLAGRKIEIALDEAARTWLADQGYDPVYGARPLKRVIQRNMQDPLAELLLMGKIADGQKVTVSAGAEGLIIDGHEVGADTGPAPSSHGAAVTDLDEDSDEARRMAQ